MHLSTEFIEKCEAVSDEINIQHNQQSMVGCRHPDSMYKSAAGSVEDRRWFVHMDPRIRR